MSRSTKDTLPRLPKPTLVDDPITFAEMIEQLHGQSVIAIDTESNSLFRYYPKVCLIQLTTFADADAEDPMDVVDYLIDPLALADIQPLGAFLSTPGIDIIMHAAENDILILQRDFSFTFHTIFDTQLAARILGWKGVGLATMLHDHFGVESDKRMQRTDWGRRPLTAKQIRYAQMDTHFLPQLRVQMIKDLKAANRWEEAKEAFAMLRHVDYYEREQAERTFWQMKSTRDVAEEELAILEALWEWREAEAQRRDRPPFKIATDQTLVNLTTAKPSNRKELEQIDGMGRQQVRQYGDAILAAIAQGQKLPIPTQPVNDYEPIEKSIQHRYDNLRHWRTHVADERGVAPEIVFSNSILMAIAQQMPSSEEDLLQIPEVGPWKAQAYGAAILKTLHNT